MKRFLLLFLVALGCTTAFGQQNISLRIHHMMGPTPFQLGLAAVNNLGSAFKVSRLQYYISDIEVLHDGGQISTVDTTWILANGAQMTEQDLGSHNVTNVEGIRFGIGVQSTVNHLDPSQYPMNHPLAPQSPSMHWGWSSGYRFVAMEGTGGQGFNQPYEIHALEDVNYFKVTVMTSGTMNGSDLVIDLDADYTQAVRNIDVAAGVISHGGTGLSVTLLENFRDHVFSASTPTGSVQTIDASPTFEMFPNPSSGQAHLRVDPKIAHLSQIAVYDPLGRVLQSLEVNADGNTVVDLESPGCYWVVLRQKGHTVATKRLVIAQ